MKRAFYLPPGWELHAKADVPADGHSDQRILGYRVTIPPGERRLHWPLDQIPDARPYLARRDRTDQIKLAQVLLEAFKNAQPDHHISKHPISFMATFADMANDAIEFMDGVLPTQGSEQ